jgi:uncharacterized membrane protein HdeD (DUF308 family)
MNKTSWGSIIIGAVVFVVSLILPFLGNRNFLWFTVSGPSYFGSSGTLYFINPIAMPLVLILWLAAVFGLYGSYSSKRASEAPNQHAKVGIIIGIINVLMLGLLTMIIPLLSWCILGRPASLL